MTQLFEHHLDFATLPRVRATNRSEELSREFSKLLEVALTPRRKASKLIFDLKKPGWISPVELVILACSIRALATRDVLCRILLPDEDNILFWTLHSYRFPQLLGFSAQTKPWHKRIEFDAPLQPTRKTASHAASRRVIPLTWIELETFGLSTKCTNLYREEPHFDTRYTQFLHEILTRHGFIAADSIDTFVRGILREIGWNAVLHSACGNPSGFAAFAGQVLDDGKALQFALSDSGCGVAATLREPYREARKAGRVPDYQVIYSCAETSAIVRYAFDAESTSRRDFPNQYDLFSDRGLALVAEIARESGTFNLVSSNALVRIDSTNEQAFQVIEQPYEILGTTIFGDLRGIPQEVRHDDPIPTTNLEKHLDSAVPLAFAVILERRCKHPLKMFRRLLARTRVMSYPSIIDFGFADPSARIVENAIALLIARTASGSVIVANNRSPSISPARIARQLAAHNASHDVTVRILQGSSKLKEIRLGAADYAQALRGSTSKRYTSKTISPSCMSSIQFRITSAYLQASFASTVPSKGFYRGEIHLLSGNTTDKYFSLVAHLEGSEDSEGRRWIEARDRLLKVARRYSTRERLKLIGFSASTRAILDSLEADNPDSLEAYCLLSYDAPSRRELEGVIFEGDEVLLFTDVLSTASLLSEIVSIARRIGATVVAIISLVDARANENPVWEDAFEPDISGVPLLTAGAFERKLLSSTENKFGCSTKKYWVDPVSAVPIPHHPFSPIDIEKVKATLNILSVTKAVEIGHFVSGLRHTSLRIDMRALLSARTEIAEMTRRELRTVRETENWSDEPFCPNIALVPAGIQRIDRLDIRTQQLIRPPSEIYADIVFELMPSRPRLIPVARSFEPGGQARCASVGHIAENENIRDLLIVDDGISSGSTLRSLVLQGVRSGARRILVFALLARTAPEELEQWMLTSEVSDESAGKRALVKLVTPLLLPVPFDSESSCAQCGTLAALATRGGGRDMGNTALNRIRADIRPSSTYRSGQSNTEYSDVWVRTHALSEVASRSVEGFELLRADLEAVLELPDVRVLERSAVIRLYLVEWRLLGRSRLRQVVRKIVRDIARKQLRSSEVSSEQFLDALSLIRALYPDEYFITLQEHTKRVVSTEEILDRCLLHIDSFATHSFDVKRDEIVHQLSEMLSEIGGTGGRVARQSEALAMLASTAKSKSLSDDPLSKLQLLKVALGGPAVRHDVTPVLVEITKLSPRRLSELREQGYFTPIADQIDEQVIPTFDREIFSLLTGFGQLISLVLQQLRRFGECQSSYFGEGGMEVITVKRDLEQIRDAFRNIAEGLQAESALSSAIGAAKRALHAVLLPDSILNQVLSALVEMSVADAIRTIAQLIEGLLPNGCVETDYLLHGDGLENAEKIRVFAPKFFILQFATLVKTNLEKHVIAKGGAQIRVRVLVSGGTFTLGSRQFVCIHVANTGPERSASVQPKFRSRRFNKELGLVDGQFVPAEGAPVGFSSSATLKLRAVTEAFI